MKRPPNGRRAAIRIWTRERSIIVPLPTLRLCSECFEPTRDDTNRWPTHSCYGAKAVWCCKIEPRRIVTYSGHTRLADDLSAQWRV